jgi:hypothetical protein
MTTDSDLKPRAEVAGTRYGEQQMQTLDSERQV